MNPETAVESVFQFRDSYECREQSVVRTGLTDLDDLDLLNRQLSTADPQAILRWAWQTYSPDIGVASSFQTHSVPLLHMIAQAVPAMTVYFLDTGFHFSETLIFRDYLVEKWKLNLKILKPELPAADFLERYGELYRFDPQRCCQLNKVQPWQFEALQLSAWITGIRSDQTAVRRDTPIISRTTAGSYRICPLTNWTGAEIKHYRHKHSLPAHPLYARGYRSIGCLPCTRPVRRGEGERAGRWPGHTQEECGLHETLMASD